MAVAMLVLSACSGGATKPTEVKISAPTPGAVINVGQGTVIQGEAVGDNITRVEVIIDGQPYASLSTPDKNQGVPNFPVQVPWTPGAAGSHAIQMRAFGPEDKLLAQSEPLVVEAKTAVAQATAVPPTPTLVPTQAPSNQGGNQQGGTQQGGQEPAQTPAPTQAPANEGPSLTVTNDFVNVRTGPNTAYQLLGRLNQGEKAPVRGKSADGAWWQISYASGPGGIGWVFGEYVQANGAAASVPVASAPPLPTQPPAPPAQPAPQPTAVPPTAPVVNPGPTLPVVGSLGQLRVNQNPVSPGGSVTAFWNVQNIDGIWFDRGDGAGFQAASGTQNVVVSGINAPRNLQLKWKNKDGSQPVDTLTVGISGAPVVATLPATGAWAPKFKAGSTNWSGPDTCTEASAAGGSCTYYWADMYGASGIWIRVEPRDVACAPTGGVNIDPGDAANNWKPLAGPSGSVTIKFNSTGGHVVKFKVAKDGNDSAFYDEKPMKVQPCTSGGGGGGGGTSPTATPDTSVPTPVPPAP